MVSSVPSGRPARSRARLLAAAVVAAVSVLGLAPVAQASSVTTAAFTGGTGTYTSGGVVFAKNGGALTLSVSTSSDTQCVDVAGALTGHQTSATGRSSWSFTFAAGQGDGAQSVTASASPSVNPQGTCTGKTGSAQASFTLDNTGPVVTGVVSPTPNAAGWNKSNVAIAWSATDAGSGVATGPTPASATVTAETAVGGQAKTASATDRLGNAGSGSVTVRLDKTVPLVTATRSPAANAAGWNNTDVTVAVGCTDALSGIKTCTGGGSVTLSTEGADQSVAATAVDNADNAASTTIGAISIDKTKPSLSGAPTTAAVNGWYRDDVTVHWTAADGLSGIPTTAVPADSTISGEGADLTTTASVSDRAGNTTQATSTPVSIDRTAPVTAVSGPSSTWTNGDVTLTLSPTDIGSGVASTTYAVDGGVAQNGRTLTLSAEGDHTVTFSSTDVAGNVEPTRTVHVRIDKTAPQISHAFTPSGYTDGGWTNAPVQVTFTCTDAGSGVASCTDPVTRTAEGAAQQVQGTATDQAGNSATDTASVSIDLTPPTVSAAATGTKNAAGWYRAPVTVAFTCADALSGVADCPASRTLGEGAAQSATGTARDAAGNAASDAVTGIDVDLTAPELSAAFTGGWHTGDVAVDWSCTDALSGPAAQPANDVVTGEGGDLSSSAQCTDVAGNTGSRSVAGIKIDRTAPTTTVSVPDALASGWYAGPVQVTLTGHDALSGVAHTFYSVDGGDAQAYDAPFSFDTKGVHTLQYWSQDVAGNVEDGSGNTQTLRIDGIAPTTTVIDPISPASGWFVTDGIPVAFAATDAESGVAATYYAIDGGDVQTYGEPFSAPLGTGVHTVRYWSVDLAGNAEAEQTVSVSVDLDPPTIQGSRTPAPNAYGWNNSQVSVSFSCDDLGSGLSGVVACGPDTVVSSEGAAQSVVGSAQDVAGNVSHTTVGPISIDTTAPTLDGAATTAPNAAGWYNGDVTVGWTGTDGLSGIDALSRPADSVVTGEGRGLGASATVSDRAGNVGHGSVTGIRIDRTAPSITGTLPSGRNAAGWYRGAVTVGFTCSDPDLADGSAGSGVATCPSDGVLSDDGVGQSLTSAPAADVAGNVRPGVTVGGIDIDGHAPQTTADNQCTKVNGWCTGSSATVVLSAKDAGPSGVKELHYTVNGGAEHVLAGASGSVNVPLDGEGTATIGYWAVDNAGNTEKANSADLKYDTIAPTVTHTVSPAPNAAGWNTGDATVHFSAADTGSGVDASTVTPDVVVDAETAGRVVAGTAGDVAGNVGTDSVTVKLDRTAPSVGASVTSGTLGGEGWYTGPVTVRFACSDALSGVATCDDPVTLAGNGSNQSVTGHGTDVAGNTGAATISGIKIDSQGPSVDTVNVAGGFYTLGSVPAPICTASDAFSGVASCTVTVAGGTASGVGTFTYTATAVDKAGNRTVTNGQYKVVYRFDGFLQPINDTAHQVGTSTSIFKAGSTVPVKLQLKKADGTVVTASTAPVWLTPVKGSATSAPVDETAYTASADSGSTYRYDGTSQQYQYNWKTGSGGSYWRIGVTLDDGQTYYVNIGLR